MGLRNSARPLPPQLFFGRRAPNRVVKPVENSLHNTKPGPGGLWTADYRRTYGSAWVLRADDMYSPEHFRAKFGDGLQGWVLRPLATARAYVIDTLRDLKWLQARHPLYPGTEYEGGFYQRGYEELTRGWYPTLDWPSVSGEFDAVRLSGRGWRAVGDFGGPFHDWAVPSTVWFRWCFRSEPELVRWRREALDEAWAQHYAWRRFG